MKFLQQSQVWFKLLDRCFLQELPQVFVKMAVIVITVIGEMKTRWRIDQLLGCFADAHDLQRLLGTDPRIGFEITLQGAGGDAVLGRQVFYRSRKGIVTCSGRKDLGNNADRLQGAFILFYEHGIIAGEYFYPLLEVDGIFRGFKNSGVCQVAQRVNGFAVLCKVHFLFKNDRRGVELDAE